MNETTEQLNRLNRLDGQITTAIVQFGIAVIHHQIVASALKDYANGMAALRQRLQFSSLGWHWVPLTGKWYFYPVTKVPQDISELIEMISSKLTHKDYLKVGMVGRPAQ